MTGIASQVLVNGLLTGLVYVLVALGFTLIFGIMRIVNFAHGEFYMMGAYGIYAIMAYTSLGYFAALAVSAVLTGLLGVVIERVLFRPFIGREFNGLIVALALSLCLRAVALKLFGGQDIGIDRPVSGSVALGNLMLPLDRLVVGGCSLAIMAAFYLLLQHTRIGLAIRAVAQDERIASLQGVRPGFIHSLTFGIGTFLAGVAGGLMAPVYTLSPTMGEEPMLKAFVVVILGGLGSVPGAVAGGLLLGLLESAITTFADSTIATLVTFALVIVVIAVRPAGLLGKVMP